MNPEKIEISPEGSGKKLAIRVIGVGGAGLSGIEHMAQSDLAELSYVAMHTNSRVLAQSKIAQKYLIGAKRMRGLGTGGDPDLGKAAAEEDNHELKTACEGADLIFIVAGLGGGTATGAASVLARAARETGALVLALVTLPFEFEGARRLRQALAGFQQLKAAADGVICLPQQKLSRLIDEKTSLIETFSITNDLLAQSVRGIWQMLTRQGLIPVDFADLSSVVRGRHAESYFACAQAQGENRAREVVDQLLAHPLLDEGQTLADADALLLNLTGGPDLTMTDVNRLMEQVNRHAENAHLIFGAAIDPNLVGRLQVTLIASRKTSHETAAVEDEAESPNPTELSPDLTRQLMDAVNPLPRPASRYVPPPPALTPEMARQIWEQQGTSSGRRRRKALSKWRQGQLPLEIVSKGRFEKSEPTIHQGEDLDVPTYIRRGIALN